MNQDSFRKLLKTPHPGSSSTSSPVVGQATKKATLNASQPTFQPRKIKKRKVDSEYRDRASERRAGVNDYAQVESVLEDFEKKTAGIDDRDAVENQRRYLGGDKDHTILVKGLDFALLEQNKARSMLSHEEDDSLEAAFQEAQPTSMIPKKRTREDLIRELKEKRISGTDAATREQAGDTAFEEAKKVGKFKPIGATNHPTGHEPSKVNGKGLDTAVVEQKKKRRKVRRGLSGSTDKHNTETPQSQTTIPAPSEAPSLPSPRASTVTSTTAIDPVAKKSALPMENIDDIDIFADAGEYEGVDFGEEDEQPAGSVKAEEPIPLCSASVSLPIKGWFTEDDPPSISGPSVAIASIPPTAEYVPEESEEPEAEEVTRLAPLASSALPSIGDFLAMDAQAEAQKKRAKKQKKKGGEKKEKLSTEVKVDRDYKKLNTYLAKKGDGSKGI